MVNGAGRGSLARKDSLVPRETRERGETSDPSGQPGPSAGKETGECRALKAWLGRLGGTGCQDFRALWA